LAFGVVALAPTCTQAQGVQWRHDYNSARKEAHEKRRPVLLDFGTENCFWCRRLDETTFLNPHVQRILNEQFIPIKVDAHQNPFLTEVLQIQAFPTLVIAATDGKILHTLQGYLDANQLNDVLQRTLSATSIPEAMTRDYEEAIRAINGNDPARAVALLKRVTEDGKDRPVQVRAKQLLNEIESKSAVRLGNVKPAGEPTLTPSPEERTRRARDLLAQAREDLRLRHYTGCVDRCELLVSVFSDLPEGAEANKLLSEVKNNPEWVRQTCDTMSERLGNLYLVLADDCLAKNQNQQGIGYLERVIQAAPGSTAAATARTRLRQISAKP
jgi:thioredoxin-like negative regulator of GroEL